MSVRQFMEQIGHELQIHPADHETDEQYLQRVVLSAASYWMLTAIHGGDGQISIQRIKRAAHSRLTAFVQLCPELVGLDVDAMTEYLYRIHVENGSFYHTPNQVRPIRRRLIGDADCAFVRGMLPEEPVSFSGMAPYVNASAELYDLSQSFDLPAQSPVEILAMLWKRGVPHPFVNDGTYETLHGERVTRQISRAVLRKPHDGAGFDFYLLDGQHFCRIPGESNLHYLMDYAQLAMESSSARATIRPHLVSISFVTRLPAPDLRFLRYAAWPDSINGLYHVWRFSLAPDIWPIYRERLQFLDYAVEENHE